jgi:signal transduction histidine kinase
MMRLGAGWRWITARPLLADSMLAFALFVVSPSLVVLLPREVWPPDLMAGVVWTAIGSIPIAIRRTHPWTAITAMAFYSVAVILAGIDTQGIAILVLTYTAAAHLGVRASVLALGVMWLPALVTAIGLGRYRDQPMQLSVLAFVVFNLMVALLAYLAGRIVYTRRRYVQALQERARTAERTQQALADQAVADERRRIARELHDVVAHHVSVMAVLASATA